MATILETLKKFGVEVPNDFVQLNSEDLPYLLFSVTMSEDKKQLFSLLISMAIRIETLEQELFELRWDKKNAEE